MSYGRVIDGDAEHQLVPGLGRVRLRAAGLASALLRRPGLHRVLLRHGEVRGQDVALTRHHAKVEEQCQRHHAGDPRQLLASPGHPSDLWIDHMHHVDTYHLSCTCEAGRWGKRCWALTAALHVEAWRRHELAKVQAAASA